MGIRKNANFLSVPEQVDFVKACVLMKADIINPGAPPSQQYSKWDEYVAVHQMIQSAFAPSDPGPINFGHGGNGSFSFLSWHRYFLYRFELDLQSYVPGVMLPYWDWTDPAPIMTDIFLGPDGAVAGNVVSQGYFALNRPGVGGNATPLPTWWPASLTGWRLPAAFGVWQGGLQRNLGNVTSLPTTSHIRQTLQKADYRSFQNALESGSGLTPPNQMHNGMHGWIGGHMSNPAASPFDPIFYLHHCNIDRLWAMWQMDGHANEYPSTGGESQHHRNDIMYPWTGGTPGYGTYVGLSSSIPMPNYSALGPQRNVDTLDFRAAYGYTYDTLAIIGIGLDRTGSMNGITPDPMTVGAPDVTKWEAAKRGVSAFLQDCETVQDSGITYVMAGIKTFRSLLANEFAPIFPSPAFGLVKTGTSFSKASFESNIAGLTASGGTPLADALLDVQNTLVEAPFAGAPADEQRYLAMLTDGLLTTGSPMSSIPNGSFGRTAVFAMGFGTGADVDYATLASMVAKGRTLDIPQVFHGENAGTIDKFYTNTLASAIGFDTIFDPVIELFAGEHTHLQFHATSAEDAVFITAQGMDFNDSNWTFHLHGPNGLVLYGDAMDHQSDHNCQHCCPQPYVTVSRADGRLSIMVQRGNADADCWVGAWTLMAAYKTNRLDAMVMPELGEFLFPVSAGPVRGPRYARLLQKPEARKAKRNIIRRALHPLDVTPLGTNHSREAACDLAVNVYARSRLQVRLRPQTNLLTAGEELKVVVENTARSGTALTARAFARLIAPTADLADLVAKAKRTPIPQSLLLQGSKALKYDVAKLLALLEKRNRKLANLRDQEVTMVSHHEGPLHMHEDDTKIPGVYHLGVYVEGTYYPGVKSTSSHEHGGHNDVPATNGERFTRLINVAVAVINPKRRSPRKPARSNNIRKKSRR